MNSNSIKEYGDYVKLPNKGRPSTQLVSHSLVGVEVEGEGEFFGDMRDKQNEEGYPEYWDFVEDGSLRGVNFEAVLAVPLAGARLISALETLEATCAGSEATFGARTSTHVHINALDMTIGEISLMLGVSLVFEDALFHYVGRGRVDNNYCTPLVGDRTSSAALQTLGRGNSAEIGAFLEQGLCAATYRERGGGRHSIAMSKYSALNLRTLSNFGTLEFRHHGGTSDKQEILQWINILLSMKEWSVRAAIPVESLPEYASGLGIIGLAREVFGTTFPYVAAGIVESSGYAGLRCIQSAFNNLVVPKCRLHEVEDSLASKMAPLKKHIANPEAIQLIIDDEIPQP